MTKQIFYFLLMVTLLTTVACGGEDVDVTPPLMEVVTFTPVPVADEICGEEEPAVFHLTGGDQLTFDVVFSDNDALSQYKVDIHNNFDCHGHNSGRAPSVIVPNVPSQTDDWTVLDIQNLDGTSSPIKRTLNVPQNVTTGNYHFQIQVVDESGNDDPTSNFFSLKINNPLDSTAPQITLEAPISTSFSVKKGDVIQFTGRVTDDRSLSDGGNGVVFLAYTDLDSGNTFSTDVFSVFDASVDRSFDFDFMYTVPQTLTTGNYQFSIGANDGVRNVAPFQFFEVEVTN
ncbi:MAG: DUF4625 domain-containing protein [Bacteroidota bacterium]